MKWLAVIFLCGLSTMLRGQTPMQTFTSADGMFQFTHPGSLIHCTQQKNVDGSPGPWMPVESCDAIAPVCDDDGSQGSSTLVCFAYSNSRFKDYPAFNAAAFAVAKIQQAVTEKECLAGSSDWAIEPRGTGGTADINHVKFKMFATSDAGMSHYLDGHMYRNFHQNTCYELGIRVATTNPGVFDPPIKELSQKDWDEVHGSLQEALESFRFLQ